MTKKIAMIGAGRSSLSSALLAVSELALFRGTTTTYGPILTTRREPKPKTPTRCGLPGCSHTTTHNGGYCCADHCRLHQRERRTANVKDEARL